MTEKIDTTAQPFWKSETARRWGIRVAALLVAFLLGLVPMWLSMRSVNADLTQTRSELHRNQMETTLAAAVIDARRGKYESARQEASGFFGQVRNELDNVASDRFSNEEKAKVGEMISNRDEIITLLSRADSAGAERLSDLYVSYRQTMHNVGTATNTVGTNQP